MRCTECGHNLDRVADGAPCTECGVVTPSNLRLPQPLPSRRRLSWLFGWPLILTWLIGLVAIWASKTFDSDSGALIVGVLVCLFIVGPANSAWCTHTLMQTLPRRARSTPLLLMVPCSIAIPVLVGVATVIVFTALTFGACMTVLVFGQMS